MKDVQCHLYELRLFLYFYYYLLLKRPRPTPTLFPLHDALPICAQHEARRTGRVPLFLVEAARCCRRGVLVRSEEHTSELQSRGHLVCRLLLEKKNQVGLFWDM